MGTVYSAACILSAFHRSRNLDAEQLSNLPESVQHFGSGSQAPVSVGVINYRNALPLHHTELKRVVSPNRKILSMNGYPIIPSLHTPICS